MTQNPTSPGEGGLTDLISRLEAAEVGSRELDGAIERALADPNVAFPDMVDWARARYTTSLDAALALAEWVLPNATHWEVCTPHLSGFDGPYAATISDPRWLDVSKDDWESHTHGEASGKTPALALCIAILRARATNTPEAEGGAG